MRITSMRPGRAQACTLALLVVLAACDESDDFFCNDDCPRDAGRDSGSDSGPPPLPEFTDVGPYMHQEACVECMQAECADDWDACMADAAVSNTTSAKATPPTP